jgi:exopolysaccharide biosynthesis WecB/TagA/CpsF family protein/anti-anti-sigma factor
MAVADKPSDQITLILGIPVDDLSLASAVERTLALIADYRRDGRPRQVVTVNVDFLTNALGWTPWSAPRHPELLEILRRADLVTADGMPVVWLARLLGTPLQGRVTGADLTPALASAMAAGGQSLFLLGGQGDIGRLAAEKLVADHPGLRIAGVYSPFVHTEGEAMLVSEADDAEIVARINAVEPDLLLIAFGNPKQEIWFHRNRHRLKAGVSIGIGGTFEFIVGRVARAPVWMQRTGLEWIWRISQDPKRLWKRYAVGLAKLAVMGVPLVAHDRFQRWRFRHRIGAGAAGETTPASASGSVPADGSQAASGSPSETAQATTAEVVRKLPEVADAEWVRSQQGSQQALDAWQCETGLVVDFSATRFLDSTALGFLVRVWKGRQNARKPIRAQGLNGPEVLSLLKMTRILDLFTEVSAGASAAPARPAQTGVAGSSQAAPSLVTAPAPAPIEGLMLTESESGIPVATLSGRLDADWCVQVDFNALVAQLGCADLVLYLSDLSFVDSTGLGLMFRLQRALKGDDRRLVLCHLQPAVRQLMEITRLTQLFEHRRTRAEALALLREPASSHASSS